MQLSRERIAQLILVRFGSHIAPNVKTTDDFPRVEELVQRHRIGGVVLFNGGPAADTRNLLTRLQATSSAPLLVAADMERGIAQQTTDLVAWPHALAFEALEAGGADEFAEFARLSAAEARSVGVQVSLSPVADIHRHPNNPIIRNRAPGATAARVAELAAAYVRGCQAGGLLCCAKHFPGHGGTTEDSHHVMPVVADSLDKLKRNDFVPFGQAIAAGADLIMSAHVAYPMLDPSGTPATLSRPILTDMLRGQWGYDGAVISDSLQMAGVRGQHESEAVVAVAAIRAGVDLLLDVSDVIGVIDALEGAASKDRMFAARLGEAARRMQRLKQLASARLASSNGTPPDTAGQHALMIARRALKILHDDGRLTLPIPPSAGLGFLLINPLGDDAYAKTNHIVDLFRKRSHTKVCVLDPNTKSGQPQLHIEELSTCDICLVAIRDQYGTMNTSWREPVQRLITTRPTIVAALGEADVLDSFPRAALQLVTFSDVPVCQQALWERITAG